MEHKSFEAFLANSVRSAIADAGLSVRAVSELAAVPLTTLDRKLRDGNFTATQLHRIAQSLGRPVGSFLPDEDVDAA